MPETAAERDARHANALRDFFRGQNVPEGGRPKLPAQGTQTRVHLNNAAPGKNSHLGEETAQVLRDNGYADRVVTDPETRKIHFTLSHPPLSDADHAANLRECFNQQNVPEGGRPKLPVANTPTRTHLDSAAPEGRSHLGEETAQVLRDNGYGDRVVTDPETRKVHFTSGRSRAVLSDADHAANLRECFNQQNVPEGGRPKLPVVNTPTGTLLSNAAPGRTGRLGEETAQVLRDNGYGDRVVTDSETRKIHFIPRTKLSDADHAANLRECFNQQNVPEGGRPTLPARSTQTGLHLSNAAPGRTGRLGEETAQVLRDNGYADRVVTDPETRKIHFLTGGSRRVGAAGPGQLQVAGAGVQGQIAAAAGARGGTRYDPVKDRIDARGSGTNYDPVRGQIVTSSQTGQRNPRR
ncbi:hypothetical protein ACIBL8_48525 [Streptomyces sp. NPDC050523]|uniref:hypothetical protein n=1 Tax=Streptomyces sp. NPDC050523 TaxID=3365622 RepID=UPI003787FD3C